MNYLLMLGPVALLLALYGIKTHYYNEGKLEERTAWEQKMAIASAEN